MTRGTILLMLAAVAGLTGCNKSGPGTADIAASQAEALAALKALDATIEPAEPNAEQPVTRIELNNDKVTDTTLDYIARFPRLKTLRLRNTSVTSAGLAKLKGSVDLQLLDLKGSEKIGDDGLAKIAHLAGLRTLSLNGTAVTDAGMANVGRLTGLEVLDLDKTAVGDAGLAKFKSLVVLNELGLNGTKVTDVGLEYLKALPALHKLSVYGTAVTLGGVDSLKAVKPNIEVTR